MGLDGEREIVGFDAAAVVGDPDQVAPPARDLDVDPGRAGIEGVLQQLLDHAGRTLHHLAGGDLIDEGGRKSTDPHQPMVAAPGAPP